MVWQSRQINVPLTSSGCTGWVRTTCAVIFNSEPSLAVLRLRNLKSMSKTTTLVDIMHLLVDDEVVDKSLK